MRQRLNGHWHDPGRGEGSCFPLRVLQGVVVVLWPLRRHLQGGWTVQEQVDHFE